MCSLQEWQVCLPYFCCYLSFLLYLTLIMYWFSVCYVSRTLFGIFWFLILGSNEEQDQTICHIQEWQLRLFLLLELSPLLVFEFDFLSRLCNTNTLWNILMMLGTNVEQDEMTCCIFDNCGGIGGGHLLLFFFFLLFFLFLKNLF